MFVFKWAIVESYVWGLNEVWGECKLKPLFAFLEGLSRLFIDLTQSVFLLLEAKFSSF